MSVIRIAAATAEEASRIYATQRDFSSLDAAAFPAGIWQGRHISYDGRIWDSPEDPAQNLRPYFCPIRGYRSKDENQ